MKKKYKIKKTNSLIKQLQPYVKAYQIANDSYYNRIEAINKDMQKAIGIKDIEICEFESGWGIGNASRTMELIHDSELIEVKMDEKLNK